nr:translation initiation factor IF-2 [Pan paniscus]
MSILEGISAKSIINLSRNYSLALARPASFNFAARCKGSFLRGLQLGTPRWLSLTIKTCRAGPTRPGRSSGARGGADGGRKEAERRTAIPISSPRGRGRAGAAASRERARDEAGQSQSTGPGLGGAAEPGGRRPLPSAPRPSPPSQARRGRGGPARPSPPRPARTRCGRLRRGSRGGGGAGVPRRRILPRGWRRGRGARAGNGGLGRTPARHERGPREGSWVKSGRAAPGERGEEPGSGVTALEPRVQSPPRERSEQKEPFCFRPRQHAPLLTELLFLGCWGEELHCGALNPTPTFHRQHTSQLNPSSQLSSQPPVLSLQ